MDESSIHVLAREVREGVVTATAARGPVEAAPEHRAVMALDHLVDDIVERVRRGAAHGVDDALTFLEADPWCFRSGYAKERLLRALGPVELTGLQRHRAAAVVRTYVLGPDRREFRQVARLARALPGEVQPFLLATLRDGAPDPARHALWILVTMPGLDQRTLDLPRARELVLSACTDADVYDQQKGWLAAVARRLGSKSWHLAVTERALEAGETALLRLLVVFPGVRLSQDQAHRLAQLVMDDLSSDRLELPADELGVLCGLLSPGEATSLGA